MPSVKALLLPHVDKFQLTFLPWLAAKAEVLTLSTGPPKISPAVNSDNNGSDFFIYSSELKFRSVYR